MAKKTGKRGRPKKERGEGRTASFALRVKPEDLVRIDQEAARTGKSRSKYILEMWSSKISATEDRRPDIREVMRLCEKVVKYAEKFAGIEWHENSFMPAVIGAALQGVLVHYGRKALMAVPEKIKNLQEHGGLAVEGQEPPSTPAEVARIIQMLIIADLEISDLRNDPESPTMFSSLVLRNEKLKEEDKAVIPPEWPKDAQTLQVLRSIKPKED
jgi:hypothetical protein